MGGEEKEEIRGAANNTRGHSKVMWTPITIKVS